MVRLDPDLKEYFYETICSFLLEIHNSLDINNLEIDLKIDEIINEIFFDFINSIQNKIGTPQYKHNISKELEYEVRDKIINRIFKSMFTNVQLSNYNKEKIISSAVNLFKNRSEFFNDIEVDEEKYMKKKYPFLTECLDELDNYYGIEEWFLSHFENDWEDFKLYWQKYKENLILKSEFLKKAFNTFGESKFLDVLSKYPPINDCICIKNKNYQEKLSTIRNSKEYRKSYRKFVKNIKKENTQRQKEKVF
ncbi:MAG: hypothetical protein EU540_01510 [Promethearchaeota archaeon]|nr:MAG: hypothetical protein EU540_01510 [Candidatus Lokiarchaeota archaeon]